MVKKVMYGLTLMFVASMIIGCGSDADKMGVKVTNSDIQPHMFTRAVDVNNNSTNLNISNDENYYKFNINSAGEHFLVYIDTDQNSRSGYTAFGAYSVGAEYLIEDNRIYKYTGSGGYDWSWSMIGNTVENEVGVIAPNIFTAKLPLDTFGVDINIFNARAITLDNTWSEIAVSNKVVFTRVDDNNLVFDFMGSSKYTTYEMGQDKLNLYFSSTWSEFDDDRLRYHLYYIDVDADNTSGYTPYGMPNMGAEYLVEEGALYKYADNRSWEKVRELSTKKGFVEMEGEGTYQLLTTLPKRVISQANELLILASTTYDENWLYVSQADPNIYNIGERDALFVYKYAGSKQCELGSGTSLEDMALELEEVISMYAANDGLNRIQLCGTETGEINVYEIKFSYFLKARSLGFSYFK